MRNGLHWDRAVGPALLSLMTAVLLVACGRTTPTPTTIPTSTQPSALPTASSTDRPGILTQTPRPEELEFFTPQPLGTLPPRPTLTSTPSPTAVLVPTWDPDTLNRPVDTAGPWLLFCGRVEGQVATFLGDLDGSAFERIGEDGCLEVAQVSPGGEFAAVFKGRILQIVQFPSGKAVLEVELPGVLVSRLPASQSLWSPQGRRLALPLNVREGPVPHLQPPSDLYVLDLQDRRLTEVFDGEKGPSECQPSPCPRASGEHVEFLSWSPEGNWLIVQDSASWARSVYGGRPPLPVNYTAQGETTNLFAISSNGRSARWLMEIPAPLSIRVIGWSSEATAFTFHGDWDGSFWGAGRVHRHNIVTRQSELVADRVYTIHAFDPGSSTLLSYRPYFGDAGFSSLPLFTRMTAAGGWEPQELAAGSGSIMGLSWVPELEAFYVVRYGSDRGRSRVQLLNTGGENLMSREIGLVERSAVAGLVPSPNSSYLLFNGNTWTGDESTIDEGMVLLNRAGETVRTYARSAQGVVWAPGSEVFYVILRQEGGLYAAGQDTGWKLERLASPNFRDSPLVMVKRAERPFHVPCDGAPASRIAIGDEVYVSDVPAIPSRLRKEPSTTSVVIARADPGARLTVLEGPECSDGFVWWSVSVASDGDISGWAAEGDAEGAWLVAP